MQLTALPECRIEIRQIVVQRRPKMSCRPRHRSRMNGPAAESPEGPFHQQTGCWLMQLQSRVRGHLVVHLAEPRQQPVTCR
jgi:hypothetical protein